MVRPAVARFDRRKTIIIPVHGPGFVPAVVRARRAELGRSGGEQVHVLNLTNGARAVTYAIEGGPGELGLNGAIAHLGAVGDLVIVITYAHYEDAELGQHVPRIVLVDAHNRARTEAVTP